MVEAMQVPGATPEQIIALIQGQAEVARLTCKKLCEAKPQNWQARLKEEQAKHRLYTNLLQSISLL